MKRKRRCPATANAPLSALLRWRWCRVQVIAKAVFFFAWLHTVCHFANYYEASGGTLAFFRKWGWGGTAFFTGFIILVAMFFIYTAASQNVKNSKFEVRSRGGWGGRRRFRCRKMRIPSRGPFSRAGVNPHVTSPPPSPPPRYFSTTITGSSSSSSPSSSTGPSSGPGPSSRSRSTRLSGSSRCSAAAEPST